MLTTQSKWPYVSRSKPCEICGRPDWCQISPDGGMALCHRVQSSKANKKGDGWFHKTSGAAPTASKSLQPRPAPQPARNDLHILAKRFTTAMHAARLNLLASSLGLSAESLTRLEVGWCADEPMLNSRGEWIRLRRCYSFPMRNAEGRVTGLRMRSQDGRKFAFTGGTGGLFIPRDLQGDRLFVAEGPTDTAAAIDLGLNTIGRESCSAGVQLIIELIKRYRFPELVIFSQRDEAKPRNKQRPELGVWYPAQEGAERLAAIVRVYVPNVRVIMPPIGVKDIRIWKHQGATAADVQREVLKTPSRKLKFVSR